MTQPDPLPLTPEYFLGLEERSQDTAALSTPDKDTLIWAEHLAPLYAALPERRPSPALWDRILRSSALNVHPGRGRVWVWQGLAAAFGLLSIGLGVILTSERLAVSSPQVPPIASAPAAQPALTAGLQGSAAEPGRLAFVMAASEGGAFIRSSPATARPVPGRTYHLWIVAPEWRTFVGVVSPEIQHSIPVPERARALLIDGAQLEVSLDATAEPPFQPGRIVASGSLAPV